MKMRRLVRPRARADHQGKGETDQSGGHHVEKRVGGPFAVALRQAHRLANQTVVKSAATSSGPATFRSLGRNVPPQCEPGRLQSIGIHGDLAGVRAFNVVRWSMFRWQNDADPLMEPLRPILVVGRQ
ncbi:MAG: hypothetical protein R3D69_08605 [Xanthobacteraceae bacterium]